MKKLIPILIFLFVSNVALSQSGWFLQNSGVDSHIHSIHFANLSTGWSTTACKILKTTNGGDNWFIQCESTTLFFVDVITINDSIAFATATFSTPLSVDARVLKTTNGGINWDYCLTSSYDRFYSIFFINDSTGWVCGECGGNIYKTNNMGASWEMYGTPSWPWRTHNSIFFSDLNTGYLSGWNTGLLKTTNGGLNWDHLFNLNIADVYFINNDTGWITGDGLINKTTDGGYNWSTQIMNDDTTRMSIYFNGYDTGFVVGENGLIQKTTNSGLNWIYQTSSANVLLRDVFFYDNNTGWIVGDNGTIRKTTTGGITVGVTSTTGNTPSVYSIHQNYPNPFNPVTNIRFDIPRSSHIKLIIYDALSREVTVLVNEKLNAGSYETEWDGSCYPSGVYYYRVEAGDFFETKKMVLVK